MGRLRGFLWLTAGLVVAVLAGLVAYMTLSNATGPTPVTDGAEPLLDRPTVPVVVAARRIEPRTALTAEDLESREMPVGAVPETAIGDVEEAIGRVTMVVLYPGEVLLTERVVDPDIVTADGRTALVINEDQVVVAFPAEDLMSRVNVLKPGDHVEMLFTYNVPLDEVGEGLPTVGEGIEGAQVTAGTGEEQVTFVLLQNVLVAGIIRGGGEEEEQGVRALLLGMRPQDAVVLKYMKDAGGIVDLALRSPGVEEEFPTDPVDLDYMINRYLLPTGEE